MQIQLKRVVLILGLTAAISKATITAKAQALATELKNRGRQDRQMQIGAGIVIAIIALLVIGLISRGIVKPIIRSIDFAGDVAKGAFNETIDINRKDEIGELVNALSKMRNQISAVLYEMNTLTQAVQEGRLETRGDAERFDGGWKELIMGVNHLIDAFVTPINMTANYIDRISSGDIPNAIEDQYKGDFNEIKNNINTLIVNLSDTIHIAEKIAHGDLSVKVNVLSDQDILGKSLEIMIETIRSIVENITSLTESAREGRLEKRGDSEKFDGEYAKIIQGINATLDAVINPINIAAAYIQRISIGDFPKKSKRITKGILTKLKIILTN